jgi:hypothetical protein
VKAALERLVPRIDDGIFVLLRYGEAERAHRELEQAPTLSIFGFRDHGALLKIHGLQQKAIQYDIGNPLTASRMTEHQLSAALYAPIRVLIGRTEILHCNGLRRLGPTSIQNISGLPQGPGQPFGGTLIVR